MLKIKMHEFIIALMKAMNTTSLFVSEIKYAVDVVSIKADLMLYEAFDNTLESVLEVVVNFPKVFRLSTEANSMQLIDANKLMAYADKWKVPTEVVVSITEYLNENQDPMFICGIDIAQSQENEEFICKDITYINWIWDMLDKYNQISTKDTCIAKDGTDIANITRIFNLYIILDRYYNRNLMSCYKYGVETSYIFNYSRQNKKRYIGVSKYEKEGNIEYRVTECKNVKGVPYFPDVAMGVPCVSFDKKLKLLEKTKKLFADVKNIDVRYEIIKNLLDEEYGKQDDTD